MDKRARLVGAVLAAAFALSCTAGAALAQAGSIALKGPHENKYGALFDYKASGSTSGSANDASGWEAPYALACAKTYRGQLKRSGRRPYVARTLVRNRRFSFAFEFLAFKPGRHRFCIYLINRHTGKTLARAEATWRNLAPTPQPSAVGSSECQPKRFPDESVYAQVTLGEVTCGQFEAIAYGADAAKGGSYNGAGFTCTATAQGAGSTWASAWAGTYYSYACVSGSNYAAFNWGMQYAAEPTSTLPLVKPGG